MSVIILRRAFQFVGAASFLAVAAACDRGPVEPHASPALLATSGARLNAAPTLVPLKGTFESRPTAPSADPCPAGSIRTGGGGEGTLSHLGRVTQTISGCFSPATLTSTGNASFVAANGDRLDLAVTSAFAPGGPASNAVVTTNGTITGGTGRFANATGFATIVTRFDVPAGVGTATVDGMISTVQP